MSNRIARPKSTEDPCLERRKELWGKIWTDIFIAITAAMIFGSIYIQILHHP